MTVLLTPAEVLYASSQWLASVPATLVHISTHQLRVVVPDCLLAVVNGAVHTNDSNGSTLAAVSCAVVPATTLEPGRPPAVDADDTIRRLSGAGGCPIFLTHVCARCIMYELPCCKKERARCVVEAMLYHFTL